MKINKATPEPVQQISRRIILRTVSINAFVSVCVCVFVYVSIALTGYFIVLHKNEIQLKFNTCSVGDLHQIKIKNSLPLGPMHSIHLYITATLIFI